MLFVSALEPSAQSARPQTSKSQTELTHITADVESAPCSYACIPGYSNVKIHRLKFLFRNRAKTETPTETMHAGIFSLSVTQISQVAIGFSIVM
jgi:hypothetical protein